MLSMGGGGGVAVVPLCRKRSREGTERGYEARCREGEEEEGEVLKGRWWPWVLVVLRKEGRGRYVR